MVVACGGNPPAPVEDRHSSASSAALGSGYRVQKGDTLYSIAFRYGLDFRRLAAANRIAAPYTIYPGQILKLEEADPPRVVRPVASASKSASSQSSSKPSAPATKTAAAATTTPPVKTTTSPSSAPAPKAAGGPVKAWRWPTSGRVVRSYSSTVHKGIDIGGNRGDAIQAVAAGQVVYAGTGIVGLGELVIVKHNDIYLSAYGHNNKLLVSEGDAVAAGQKIAEKGSSGTDTVRLHFEIRKEGKPIDPLRLLPKR